MSLNTLITLAEFHYGLGLIGIDAFQERVKVAYWLYGETGQHADPRAPDGESLEQADNDRDASSESGADGAVQRGAEDPSDPDYLNFLYCGWVFTKADPDPYPSTPHGHWKSQNNKWPKLDPYNGRAFTTKHVEGLSRRLTKTQMQLLWNDESFKDFCRGHLVWYIENHPYHKFRVSRDKVFRFPRW